MARDVVRPGKLGDPAALGCGHHTYHHSRARTHMRVLSRRCERSEFIAADGVPVLGDDKTSCARLTSSLDKCRD